MQNKPQHIDDFLFDDDFNEFVIGKSEKNSKKWKEYFETNPETKVAADKAKKIIEGLSSMNDKVAEKELNDYYLNHQFEETWSKYRNTKSKSTFLKASKWIWRTVAAAAVIIFAITFYSLINNFIIKNKSPEYFEVYVPVAKQSQLTLPDGTRVWINSDTKIRYSNRFNSNERDLYLTGEAYFEVSRNEKMPFKVFANSAEIKVLGTKFNVKSYAGDKKVETVLVEGKIQLSRSDIKSGKSIELNPGDKAICNLVTHKMLVVRGDVDADVAWKDGRIIFRNTPLEEVCSTLQRWYNADIILDDDTGQLRSHPFTFTVMMEDLPLVLEYLCRAAPLKFHKEFIDEDGENGIEHIKYIIQPKD